MKCLKEAFKQKPKLKALVIFRCSNMYFVYFLLSQRQLTIQLPTRKKNQAQNRANHGSFSQHNLTSQRSAVYWLNKHKHNKHPSLLVQNKPSKQQEQQTFKQKATKSKKKNKQQRPTNKKQTTFFFLKLHEVSVFAALKRLPSPVPTVQKAGLG